jgi:hypothetical protein
MLKDICLYRLDGSTHLTCMGFFYYMKIEVIAFKTEHAENYGIEAAILIQGIQLGLHLNKSKPSHIKMGKGLDVQLCKGVARSIPIYE